MADTTTPFGASPEYKAQIVTIVPLAARYSVVIEGANAVAYDLNDGSVISTSASHDVAINAALALADEINSVVYSLTGAFTLSSSLLAKSKSTILLNGSIKGSTNSGVLLVNADTVAGNVDISVSGGEWDGVSASQTSNSANGLHFEKCTNISIRNISTIDTYRHGVSFKECFDVSVDGSNIKTFGDDGISFIGLGVGGVFTGNIIDDGRSLAGAVGSSGIEIEDGAKKVIISSNLISNIVKGTGGGGDGIHCTVDSGSGQPTPEECAITNNLIFSIEGTGIDLTNNELIGSHSSSSVTGNVMIDCFRGMSFTRVDGCSVMSNVIDTTGGNSVNFAETVGLIFNNNVIKNSGGRAISVSGIDTLDISVSYNYIENTIGRAMTFGSGKGAMVCNNIIVDTNGGSPTTTAIQFLDYASPIKCVNNSFSDNIVTPTIVKGGSTTFSDDVLSGNSGLNDTVSGTATIAAGLNFVDVVHNLGIVLGAGDINITPQDFIDSSTSTSNWWIPAAQLTSNKFRIQINGTIQATPAIFGWSISAANQNFIP